MTSIKNLQLDVEVSPPTIVWSPKSVVHSTLLAIVMSCYTLYLNFGQVTDRHANKLDFWSSDFWVSINFCQVTDRQTYRK